jgi:hypothetical protein
MERAAQNYEKAGIGAGLDYGIHFLEPELCVNAVREFLAEQRS